MGDRNADVIEIRARVDRVLAERRDQIWPVVRAQIAEILEIDPARIEPSSNLLRDLGITSLDLLDLTYRMESAFDLKIARGPIQFVIQNGLDEPIGADGGLGPQSLERLRIVMPEADPARVRPGLQAHSISDLYTAETFARLVAMALSTTNPSTFVATE
jgi:acyl carrier protein